MAKIPEIKVICNRCGKEAPLDETKSNENWKVYKINALCECGGSYEPCVINNKEGLENE